VRRGGAAPSRRWSSVTGYRLRALTVIATVALLQLVGWCAAALVYRHNRALLALCGVAFVLGLRHALDADHIAAIDNASRNIAGRGERAPGVGLFFALGHSSVVVATTFVVATAAIGLFGVFANLREVASTYATLLSVGVLFVVAPRNISAALSIYGALRQGGATDLRHALPGGVIARLVRPLLRLRVRSWHMLFVGILFGLGFETATAISVLALAAAQSGSGLPIGSVMIIPLLFTAGMTLVDASDGLFMERAYGWALRNPRRHAVYNLIVTSLSASVALIVGGIELITVIRHFVGEDTPYAHPLEWIGEHFDGLGASIVGAFVIIWVAAKAVSRIGPTRRPGRLWRSPGLEEEKSPLHSAPQMICIRE